MVVLRCSDVPAYLCDSDFYRNLDKGDDDEFTLSFEHFKRETTVENDSDLDHLLSTLRFWGAVSFPETAIRFTLQCSLEILSYITGKYGNDFDIISSIDLVRRSEPDKKMNKAIKGGSIELVQFLHQEGYDFNRESAVVAAMAGSVSILRYMHGHGHQFTASATNGAAEMGQLDCLQNIHSNNFLLGESAGVIAAARGHVACLKNVLESGLSERVKMCLHAAQNGHHECLQYLIENNLHAPGENWIRYAADSGNLQCLQLAFNLVQSWPTDIQHSIIIRKNFDCFKYSLLNGCHYTWDDIGRIAGLGLLQHLQYIKSDTSLSFDAFTMQSALLEGHVDCVEFLYKPGYVWGNVSHLRIIENNHYDCLVFMQEHGAVFGLNDCNTAARYGRLQCLQYLHTQGVMCDQSTCRAAAEHGHLDCLQYLHESGCPWDAQTTTAAWQNKHKDCYTYAKKHGCPMPSMSSRFVKWIGL